MPLHSESIDPVEAAFDSVDLVKIEFVEAEDQDGIGGVIVHYRVPEEKADGGVGTRTRTVRGSDTLIQGIRDDDEATRILGMVVNDTVGEVL